jgi:hypothetical protein
MKFLRLLFVFFTAAIVFSSCQKELIAETGTAVGSLVKDAGGDCTALVSGAYKKDTLLTASNFVDIQVNITEIGNYTITTDTVNGYYFKATGLIAVAGLNSIRLVGVGKPIAVGTGTDVFTVKFAGTSCEINVNVTGNTGGGTAAVFTLGSTAGACTGFTLGAGTYTPGTALGATNTVTLNVNVVTAGSYTLTATTSAATGVIFTGTGSFSAGTTGAATIVLTAQPAPGNTGNSPTNTLAILNAPYSVSAGGTSCDFLVGFNAPLGPATYTIACASTSVTGNYLATVPLTSNEKVTLIVNATVPGSFSITTDVKNNVKFIASGNLVMGNNTVILNAAPANNLPSTAFSFTYAIAGSTCTFPIAYGQAPTSFMKAKINGSANYTFFNTNLTGLFTSALGVAGFASAGVETMGFGVIGLNTPVLNTLYTYSVASSPIITGTVYANYTSPVGVDYTTDNFGGANTLSVPFIFTFKALTANHVIGTFSGKLRDGGGNGPNEITFTAGEFDVTF